MKNLLIITMLLGVGYSQCNESNWQEYYPDMQGCYLVGADLYEANLEGANLSYAYLTGANLEGSDLYRANLTWADLSWANLYGANLGGAILSGAFLIVADLTEAILSGAYLVNANLQGANLSGAQCIGAFFVGAILDNYTIFEGTNLTYAYFDENADQYDDVSYEAGAMSGDLNLDGVDNILDVVTLVNQILEN